MSSIGQSLPYNTLLKLMYDSKFPVIQAHQKDTFSEAIIIDTREKDEFEVSHIKGAKWVGFENFEMASVADLPKNTPIILYCSVGVRSEKIGKQLKEAGFKEVYNLYGGIFQWINEGNPVYRNEIQTSKIHPYSPAWGFWLKKGKKVYEP